MATLVRRSFFCGAALALLAPILSFSVPAHAATERDQAAALAARWLSLVDHQHYADAWQDTTKQIPLAKFLRDRTANQQHEGDAVARRLWRVAILPNPGCFSLECFGRPDGDGVVFFFQSSFDKKRSTVERVSVVFDHGTPKIDGYSVR
jgi:hypothetical protein